MPRLLRACLAVLFACHVPLAAGETVTIAGSGSSTLMVTEFFAAFAATPEGAGFTFVVPPKSIKHLGGMEWAASGNEIFGRSGRPLDDEDRAKFPKLRELLLARLPIGFAVPKTLGITALSSDQLAGVLTGKITNWKEVGGPDLPVMRLGREATDSSTQSLLANVPYFKSVVFDKILKKDPEMLTAISKTPGSIGYSSADLLASAEGVQLVTVAGFEVTQTAGLLYDVDNEKKPLVVAVSAFAASKAWSERLRTLGLLPVK